MTQEKKAIKFGTDGWRAKIGEEFTFDNVRSVSQAIAEYFKAHDKSVTRKGLVVGYDTRFLSSKFAQTVAQVLAANNIPVLLSSSVAPTPAVSLNIVKRGCGGGVMVTSSHNPYEYNGIKIKSYFGGSAFPETTQAVEQLVHKHQAKVASVSQKERLITKVDLLPLYFKKVAGYVDLKTIRNSKLKVAIDPMYGAGIGCVQNILVGSRINLLQIHGTPNPMFGGIFPEPIEENLGDLEKTVKKHRCDFGIASDGDADRMGGVDGRGRFLYSSQILALLLWHLYKNKGIRGDVVYTVSTTSIVENLTRKFNLKSHVTPVGFKNIARHMIDGDVLIGGEESGGIGFKNHIPERDGILGALLLLELVAMERRRPEEILKDIEKICGPSFYHRNDLFVPMDKKKRYFHL